MAALTASCNRSHEVFCHYFFYKQRPEDRILAALVRKTTRSNASWAALPKWSMLALRTPSPSKAFAATRSASSNPKSNAADIDQDQRQWSPKNWKRPATRPRVERGAPAFARPDREIETIHRLRQGSVPGRPFVCPGFDRRRNAQAICRPRTARRGSLSQPWINGTARMPSLGRHDGYLADAEETGSETLGMATGFPHPAHRFRGPGVLDDGVVHLHLEHRVVQRLLGRFIAQGFVYHDLCRACLAQITDAIPRVILLGRLCLYGAGAAVA